MGVHVSQKEAGTPLEQILQAVCQSALLESAEYELHVDLGMSSKTNMPSISLEVQQQMPVAFNSGSNYHVFELKDGSLESMTVVREPPCWSEQQHCIAHVHAAARIIAVVHWATIEHADSVTSAEK